MKNLASNVRTKLAAIIPRLATNHDGERLATVAALQRTLAGAGNDLHDLAAAVAQEPATSRRREDHAGDRGNDRHADCQTPQIFWEELSAFERRRWLDALVYGTVLSSWESNFVDSVRRQFLDYGDRMRFSDKQVGICNRILWKAINAGVRP